MQPTATIAPAIVRTRKLSPDAIQKLKLPLIFQADKVIIERSLSDWKLQKPIILELSKLLEVQEIGLVDYIIRSCLNERPSIIPYIFDNKSLIKLSRHFLRYLSGSHRSCMLYAVYVKKYATWLGYKPDLIIADVKPTGAIPDSLKTHNHCGFLNDYLAELQDAGLKPSSVNNCIKTVKTFYHVNGIEVKLDQPLKKKVTYKDRAPNPKK